ncbi:DNA internalization-related competence protein ComEC/Rec2 [Aquibacillus halophilus]|uniref:DNA internalization-related competence protein ComEC/Rec2 n=1 Tax=Aquibacillus halophilus TaxID=930132 RepID=UPI001478EFB6
MKGNWHLLAVSYLVASFTTISINLLYCAMIILLYRHQRITRIQCIIIISSLLIFLSALILEQKESPINSPLPTPHSSNLSGTIVSSVTETDNKIEFQFKEDKSDQKTLVTIFKDTNSDQDYSSININFGAKCTIIGKQEIPQPSKNPGQFNFQNYLKQKGVSFQVTINDKKNVSCYGSSKITILHKLRSGFLTSTDKKLSGYTSSWLNALVLGDDEGISEETVEAFQRWSLSHLLAISGLHVGLIVGIFYFLLVKLQLLTKEKAQNLLILLLPIYAVIAGGAPSVWRSSLMTVSFLLLVKLRLRLSVTDVISIIFLALVLYDPNLLHQLGFQFSFMVTFALLLSKKIISRPYSKWYIIFSISVICQLSILPLQINQFYFINPLSIFVNLLYVPYFSFFVIPSMFFTFLFTYLAPPLSRVIDDLFKMIHQPILKLLMEIDEFLYFPLILGKVEGFYWFIYCLFFYLFMKNLEKNKSNLVLKYGCLLTFVLIFLAVKPYLDPHGSVTMLDVGQGDSFVIELPYRKGIFIIDAAGTMSADFVTPSNKVYKQVIKPYLYSRGIAKVDSLILSHNDHDHVGSVPFIVNELNVKQIVVSKYFSFSEETLEILNQNKIPVLAVDAGDEIIYGDQSIRILYPDMDKGTTNENSLVFYTELGGLRWLFTGDIDEGIENEIILAYPKIEVDVLKIAHHGSNTSTSEKFLTHTNPKFALISVGDNNRYGHPSLEIIERLDKFNIGIMRTDIQGAIRYKFKGKIGTFFSHLPYDN